MEKKTFNGQQLEVYTDADWLRDRTLKVRVGQVISPEVFWQLLEALPPHRYGEGVFQPGEPYCHDLETGVALYQTFERIEGEFYKYVGLKAA
jgi:hypothetical protein